MAKKEMTALSIGLPVNDFWKSNGHEHPGEINNEPSMTRQEFAEECDINSIMKRYDAYLSDPMMSLRAQNARYVDFSGQPQTLMEAMDVMREASDAFYRLPAIVRREFDNDPALWVDYAADPANLEQMRAWGLAPPEKQPDPPMRVEVVNPPNPAGTEPGKPENFKPTSAPTHGST